MDIDSLHSRPAYPGAGGFPPGEGYPDVAAASEGLPALRLPWGLGLPSGKHAADPGRSSSRPRAHRIQRSLRHLGERRLRDRVLRLLVILVPATMVTVLSAVDWRRTSVHFTVATGIQAGAILIIGVRLLFYYHSFLFHWQRYRDRSYVTTADLKWLGVPYVRLHVTTRGLAGSTEVILRGIRNVEALVAEDAAFYGNMITIEICTESPQQADFLRDYLAKVAVQAKVVVIVIPEYYQTSAGTQKKARSLHYVAELRRAGWGRRPGKTFVVHYDEESVIEAAELRKLLRCLAATDKKILEGPIYYPLEYTNASILCRTMEANRPIGCFECRSVMESGVPLHLHGSNLVVEEDFENEIGWDMGLLDGQPFIAEDYVFGVLAFLKGGRDVFGWHGVAMLEQPPFSYHSAFKQRQRWITGVLQGQEMLLRMPAYRQLAPGIRFHLIWGTRFRIFSFAIGAPVGLAFLAYVLLSVARIVPSTWIGQTAPSLPLPLMLWLSATGIMWLGSVFIGGWLNLAHSPLPPLSRFAEIAKAITLAPAAGILESAAGFWAVLLWLGGQREVSWQPTPKTKQADKEMDWSRT
jgi:hypothetical protein